MNQVDFIGNVLSLSCGEALGTFQGEVSAISKDKQTISLKNAYRNGVKYEVPEVTIRAIDIKDLTILKTSEQVLQEKVQNIAARNPPVAANGKIVQKDVFNKSGSEKAQQKTKNTSQKSDSTRNTPKKGGELNGSRTPKGKTQSSDGVDVKTPQGKRGGCKKLSYQNAELENEHALNKEQMTKDDIIVPKGSGDGNRRRHPSSGAAPYEQLTTKSQPIKIEAGRGHGRTGVNSKNRECFSAPVNGNLEDFDFDMNLKLFNKAAVFEEIDALSGDDVPVKKYYRHDENILTEAENCAMTETEGIQRFYKTVNGVTVPSISTDQQHKLFLAAEKTGLTSDRRVEATGINAAHMAMQLLGGAKRFTGDPHEATPLVVVLAGPHIQGAQGVCCARHLANHNVNVTLFLPSYVKMIDSIMSELTLFKETDGRHITNVKELPDTAVDLVVLALDCPYDVIIRDQPWYKSAITWTMEKQVTSYAIDPPADSTLKAQYTMAVCLPLSYTNETGALYLCDVGIPRKIFLSLGIEYVPPFGHKHVIPLRNS